METSVAPSSPSGRRLGRYELVRRLGHGGMAEVFEGRHVDLGKRVAIKVMQLGQDEGNVSRLLREGRAATAIHHPNVVSILDVGVESGIPYLVMELLEGEDLAKLLARDGALSVEAAVDALLPILAGLVAVHAAGIVHRDVKPSNIFLARRHRGVEPVLVDFGISKFITPTSGNRTGSQGAVGTLLYMAPEQVESARDATAKSDQYALGAVLYECVTGGPPFWGDNPYELLHAIMTAPIVAPSELNPAVPEAFGAIVLRALAREPARRFADVKALAAALLPFASAAGRARWAGEIGETVEAFAQTTSPAVTAAVPRARGRIAGIAAAAALGIAAVAAAGMRRAPPPPARAEATATVAAPATMAAAPMAAAGPSSFVQSTPMQSATIAATHETPPATAAARPAAAPRSSASAAPVRRAPARVPPAAPAASAARRGANDVPILEVE